MVDHLLRIADHKVDLKLRITMTIVSFKIIKFPNDFFIRTLVQKHDPAWDSVIRKLPLGKACTNPP